MNLVSRAGIAAALVLALTPSAARADATLAAEYLFNHSLASDVAGAPNLVAVDPLGTSGYVTDTVFGTGQTVYSFQGATTAASQGGLTLSTASLLTASNDYSVQMIFKFTTRDGAWRRIMDALNRTSDSGLYFNPSNELAIYPNVGTTQPYTTGDYINIALTVDPSGLVDAYFNGVLELAIATGVMNIDPANTLGFFLDNTAGGGQGEWSPGAVAAVRVYNGVLSQAQVNALNNITTSTVPEPASLALLGAALAGLGALRRRGSRPIQD